MQNRDGKMRSGGVEYIILEKAGGEAEIFTSREFGSVCVEAEQNLNGLWYDWTTRLTCRYFASLFICILVSIEY